MNSEFAKHFEKLAGSKFGHIHSWDLFREWLSAVWWMLDGGRDAERKQRLDRYTAEQGAELAGLLNEYCRMVEQRPFHDILGDAFMELDLASVHAGQYFTPFHVCRMMAEMNFDESLLRQKAEAGEKMTVCDPACGSGAMLLAYGQVIHDKMGRDWLRHAAAFYGMDIDERCVLMASIQLRMNGMDSFGRCMGMIGAMSEQEGQVVSLPEVPAITVGQLELSL